MNWVVFEKPRLVTEVLVLWWMFSVRHSFGVVWQSVENQVWSNEGSFKKSKINVQNL